MKLRVIFILVSLMCGATAAPFDYPFRDPDRPIEERITDLIGRMTLDEKIGNLWFTPGVPRLGVVGTNISEGYHGVAQGGPSNWGKFKPTRTTQFPQAYGLAATWNPALLRQVAANQATEVRYLFQSEKYQRSSLVVMAPNADLARDPRWGRTEETYGEDPFLTGTLAAAFARGLAGDDSRYLKAASLLKHFLANSNENGRFHTSSDFDERLWREYYAKPFEIAVRDGGARSLMASYNAYNNTPQHVHPALRAIVMGEWGADGIICTDGGGLTNLVTEHKFFPDNATATAACIKAGINLFLDRIDGVKEALTRGLITESDIDAAIRGRLRIFIRLGLLDPADRVPYAKIGRETGNAPEPWDDPATKTLVREVTRQSIVLLKNDHALLPLDSAKLKSVAVVGPLANVTLLDWYSGTPPYQVNPREGIQALSTGAGQFAPERFNVKWVGDMSTAALDAVRLSDVAIVCVGNHPEGNAGWEMVTDPSDGKEGIDRQDIALPPAQVEFIRRVHEANPRTVVVLVANFPYAMPWVDNVPALVQLTHASQEQGNALADVLFGEFNPGGKLVQTWPKSLADLPPMMDYDIRHGRTYLYAKPEPQFAFGFGLSYTTFALTNLKSDDTLARDGTIEVSVEVANTGARLGDEVVQLYVHYPQSKVERPAKALRGFQRIAVASGQTATAKIKVRAADLAYWNVATRAWIVEAGPIELRVGTSSREADLTLHKTITVQP
ncbi:MAG: glycoside hydrolase family 3 C-terminal domain-containing protein [Opitutus sp.]